MRAIDADRLQKQFDEKSVNPNYRVNMHNIKSIISNAPPVEAIPKDQYEARLKADMVAMLTEIQTEIEEIKMGDNVPFGFEPVNKFYEGVSASSRVIQQKIDKLKAESESLESEDNK